MVVNHHGVDPGPRGRLEAIVVGRAAIARHEEGRPGGDDAGEGLPRQAVPAVEAVRQEGHGVGAEGAQHVRDEGGGRHAVGVVVAEHADALAGPDGAHDATDGLAAVLHRIRRGEIGEARVEEAGRGGLGLGEARDRRARWPPCASATGRARAPGRLRLRAGAPGA